MFVAIVGCGHGEIDKIYEVVASIEEKRGIKVSLILCCGDFESVRNMTDLRCMACPVKYQDMHDFHRYYSGEKKAPVATIFIGGNHEASNYLQELPFGGWVAPNIYYLGYTGVVRFGSLRIAGISGIYKGQDYLKGRYECPPYNNDTMRSIYHYRNLDTFRLKQLGSHIDVVLSHDWPNGIHNFGNTQQLLRNKPFFRDEIQRDELGSRPLYEILTKLEPTYWFSAHLHVKFGAVVPHRFPNSHADADNPDPGKMTKFLALDKILPRRQFLQVIEIPDSEDESPADFELCYDPEWLAILKSTDYLVSTKPNKCFMPGPGYSGLSGRNEFVPTKDELCEIESIFDGKFEIPHNFTQTAPIHVPGEHPETAFPVINPQTKEFCEKLGVSDPIQSILSNSGDTLGESFNDSTGHFSDLSVNYESSISQISINPDEISLDDSGSDDDSKEATKKSKDTTSPLSSFVPYSALPRSKLVLPPPKASNLENLDLPLDGSSAIAQDSATAVSEAQGLQFLEESGLCFMIDKVGEPEVKKIRRNAALYHSDS